MLRRIRFPSVLIQTIFVVGLLLSPLQAHSFLISMAFDGVINGISPYSEPISLFPGLVSMGDSISGLFNYETTVAPYPPSEIAYPPPYPFAYYSMREVTDIFTNVVVNGVSLARPAEDQWGGTVDVWKNPVLGSEGIFSYEEWHSWASSDYPALNFFSIRFRSNSREVLDGLGLPTEGINVGEWDIAQFMLGIKTFDGINHHYEVMQGDITNVRMIQNSQPVPEPATWCLLLIGLFGVGFIRKKSA
jgi:hypothetical protein